MDIHVTGNWTTVHSQSMSVCCVSWRRLVMFHHRIAVTRGIWNLWSSCATTRAHSQFVNDFILDVMFEKGQQRSFCLNWHTCWSHGTVLSNHIIVHKILYQSWTFRSCHVTTREMINPNRIRKLIIILLKKWNLSKLLIFRRGLRFYLINSLIEYFMVCKKADYQHLSPQIPDPEVL